MSNIHDVDQLTDEILGNLLQEPHFIKEWVLRTAEILDIEKGPSTSEIKVDEVTSTFEELVRVINLSIQAFINIESSIYRFTDVSTNPDASAIFTVELQLQRLDSKPNQQRLLSSARRVNQLMRKFPSRVSKGCNVSNVLKLATSLCGMLFRLEEHLRLLKGSSDVTLTLVRSASNFNRIVVARLETWQMEIDQESVKKMNKSIPQPTTPKRRPLSLIQHRSPGGFLLKPEFLQVREKVFRSRSATPAKDRRFKAPHPVVDSGLNDNSYRTSDILRQRRQLADSMQQKWGKLLNIDGVLKSSIPSKNEEGSDSSTMRVAKRISAQVIRDLKKSFGGHSPLILTSSNRSLSK